MDEFSGNGVFFIYLFDRYNDKISSDAGLTECRNYPVVPISGKRFNNFYQLYLFQQIMTPLALRKPFLT